MDKLLRKKHEPIKGWLLVYLIVLGILTLHGLGLTVASLIAYTNPELVHLSSTIPLGPIVLYVATNLLLILYAIPIYILVLTRKRAAVLHNVIFNILSIAFLVIWHFFGMKSAIGVVVDSTPSLIMLMYILRSKRVKQTLVY